MKFRWLSMLGMTMAAFALPEIIFAIGFTKKGILLFSILSNTSLSSSGDIAEPSAKCSQ